MNENMSIIDEQIKVYKKIVTNPKTKPKLSKLYKMLGIQPNLMQQELIRLWDREYKNYYGYGLFSGRGTGKTVAAGSVATLDLLTPGASVILVSPSNAQLNIIWKQVVKTLKQLNAPIVKIDNNKKELELENGSEFAAFSEKSVEDAEGRRVSLIIIEEGGLLKRLGQIIQSLTPALGRYGTYDNGMQIGKIVMIGTPKANNPDYYQYYLKGLQEGTGWVSLSFPSSINPLNTPEFLEAQRKILDEKTYLQEYEAKWVLVTEKLVFKDFDIKKHTFDKSIIVNNLDENSIIIAGLDIGATDSTAYVLIYVEAGKYYVFDGFMINDMSEAEIAKHIKELEKKYNIEPKIRYIDPSAKLTRLGLASEHNIVTYPAMNSIKESVALINQLFRQNKLFIVKDMQELINQIQTLEWNESKTGDPFKRMKGHHYDYIAALRYAIYSFYKQNNFNNEIVIV